jgi:hypothetical protein
MAVGLYSGVSGLAVGVGLYKGVSGLWGGSSGLINGFGGSGPFPGASLYLDFLTPPLDSRITFSRGTNATLVDSTGKITYAPNNLLLWSEGTVAQLAASSNVTDASVTISGYANSIQFGDNSVTRFAYKTLTIAAGVSLIASFVVQMDDNSAPSVGTGITGGDFSIICDGGYAPVVSSALISGNIYRVWGILSSPTGGTFRNVGIIKNTGQSTKGFRVTGFQLEQVTYQTTPSTYVATTASAYYGPRFDYDPVTLAPRGLLIEEARTNLLTYSAEIDNAAWTKAALTVTANATLSPDGTATADALIENTATSAHGISRLPGLGIATYTYSIFAKANGRTQFQIEQESGGNARFTLSGNGTALALGANTASITALGNGWYRCSNTFTVTGGFGVYLNLYNGSTINYTGDGTSGIFVWGAQLEAGAFATSYIPTVASTVSRSADVATMTGTNFSSWYNQSEGTFIGEATFFGLNQSPSHGLLSASSGSSTESVSIYRTQIANNINFAIIDNAVTQVDYLVTMGSLPVKTALAYAANNTNVAVNGLAQTTDTSCTMATPDRLLIGAVYSAGSFLANGHIRAIAYYNTRLPNTQLQTLTAPSLASPLALDFISPTYTVGY